MGSIMSVKLCNTVVELPNYIDGDLMAQFKSTVVLDKIQRLPQLLSYVQAIVDRGQRNGQFVLTGVH
ncbi:hypothetical protein BST96_06750 [Oceanicoccus sagamiensis]|uniref:AAA domain-containing protein n=1 Tax=Oceanicoccus sagamiensis TaxID=716816 RepID=A0A1X9N6W5_9GAMM|nr:hypothetical protein BST96_06750 [Oceanicoccus sagamiensis]